MVTTEQYGELCDLFEQSFHDEGPDLSPDRIRSTSTQARAFATAVLELLGLDLEQLDITPERMNQMAAYLKKWRVSDENRS